MRAIDCQSSPWLPMRMLSAPRFFLPKEVTEKTLLSSKHIATTRCPRNSEAACLRLGVAVSESAGVMEMGAEALSFYGGDEPKIFDMGFGALADWFASAEGSAFLTAAKTLNKSSGVPETESDVEAAVREWLAGLAKLFALEKHVRRVAQVSARTYLWAMDALEQLATVNFPKKAFAEVDADNPLRDIKAIASMLRKPADSKGLRKAVVAAYMKQIVQGGRRRGGERPLDADTSPEEGSSTVAHSSSTSSVTTKKHKKQGRRATRGARRKAPVAKSKDKKRAASSPDVSSSKAPKKMKTKKKVALTCSSNEEGSSSQPDEAATLKAWGVDDQVRFAKSLADAWSSKDLPKASGNRLSLAMLVAIMDDVPSNVLQAYGLCDVRQALKTMSRLPKHDKLKEILDRLQELRDKLSLPDEATTAATQEVEVASVALVEKALAIKPEWCERIFDGQKRWELRSTATEKRGWLCIAASKQKRLVGEVNLVACLPVGKRSQDGEWRPFTDAAEDVANFFLTEENMEKHGVIDLQEVASYRKLFAWVFADVQKYDQPIPWRPRPGAVTFCNLAGRIQATAPAEEDGGCGDSDGQRDADLLWPGLTAEAPEGALLPHMRWPPQYRSQLGVTGPATWSGPALAVPPDGLCMLYAYLAATSPDSWAAISRHSSGFIRDRGQEKAQLARAKAVLARILTRMHEAGADTLAEALERGGYPGDEELRFYAEEFGCAILVVPTDEDACPVIHGHGSVGFEVTQTFGRGPGGAAGHFVLSRSWLPKTWPLAAEAEASESDLIESASSAAASDRTKAGEAQSPVAREKPKSWPLTAEDEASGSDPIESASSAAAPERTQAGTGQSPDAREKPPAKRRASAEYCSGLGMVACCFSCTNLGQPAQPSKGHDRCLFCSSTRLSGALTSAAGRGTVCRALKRFSAGGSEATTIFDLAMQRLELWAPEHAAGLRSRASKRRNEAAPSVTVAARASEAPTRRVRPKTKDASPRVGRAQTWALAELQDLERRAAAQMTAADAAVTAVDEKLAFTQNLPREVRALVKEYSGVDNIAADIVLRQNATHLQEHTLALVKAARLAWIEAALRFDASNAGKRQPQAAKTRRQPVELTLSDQEEESNEDAAAILSDWGVDDQARFAKSLADAWSSKDLPKASGNRLSLAMLVDIMDDVPSKVLQAYGLRDVRQALKTMSRLPKHDKLKEILDRLQELRDKLSLPDAATTAATQEVEAATAAAAAPEPVEPVVVG
ncbi:unnamed protein product [Symbiodinium microadriaticum]|nr:unnamed protein product [Symbiodinium microadriaticum]